MALEWSQRMTTSWVMMMMSTTRPYGAFWQRTTKQKSRSSSKACCWTFEGAYRSVAHLASARPPLALASGHLLLSCLLRLLLLRLLLLWQLQQLRLW